VQIEEYEPDEMAPTYPGETWKDEGCVHPGTLRMSGKQGTGSCSERKACMVFLGRASAASALDGGMLLPDPVAQP
jgi:hypothetical protein